MLIYSCIAVSFCIFYSHSPHFNYFKCGFRYKEKELSRMNNQMLGSFLFPYIFLSSVTFLVELGKNNIFEI